MRKINTVFLIHILFCSVIMGQNKPQEVNLTSTDKKTIGNDINGLHMGTIMFMNKNADHNSLAMTYSLFITPCLSGEDCPDGYYILPCDSSLHYLSIAPDLKVKLCTHSYTSNGSFNNNEIISFEDFFKLYNDSNDGYDVSKIYFWVKIENGLVTEMQEQYLP